MSCNPRATFLVMAFLSTKSLFERAFQVAMGRQGLEVAFL